MNGVYRLDSCVWEITLSCCFSCRYCGSGGGKKRENELSTEECISVAGQLASLGCRRVSLIGGEVFMRSDWDIIVDALTKRDISVVIITNGWLFTESLIEKLKSLNIESVAVSLDGMRELHDKYRQEGSFERAVNAVDMLTSHGVPTSVITTLNAENALYLDDFYAFLKTKPLCAWQLQACSPMGNAAKSGINYRFDFNDVISFVYQAVHDSPFPVGVADNIGYFTKTDGFIRGNQSGYGYFKGCRAGLTCIGIDSVGSVRGCESMYDDSFIEGNLRERTLADIWNDPDAFAYNRKFTPEKLTGKCRECELSHLCAGGCRSYNHFVHGKLYESPFCARIKESEGRS